MVCPNYKSDSKNTNIRCEKCGTVLINGSEFESIPEEEQVKEDIVGAAKFIGAANIFRGVVFAIVSIFFVGFIGLMLFGTKSDSPEQKTILLPFLACGIIIFISSIFYIIRGIKNIRNAKETVGGGMDVGKFREDEKKMNNGQNVLFKIYIVVFMLFWFGFLIVFDIHAIKSWSNGGNQLFFFSLVFWVFGSFSFIHAFKNKKYCSKV